MEEIKEKKPNFFTHMGKSRGRRLLFCLLSTGIVIVMYSVISPLIYDMKIRQYEIEENNFYWVYQVDSIENSDKTLVLNGWAFQLEKDAEFDSYGIIFLERETGKLISASMSYADRPDVNDYFLCEYDYTASGFQATIPVWKLDLELYTYEVLLYFQNQQRVFSTDIFYADGDLQFVAPDTFVPLQTAGTDLEEITENGVLRVYQPKFGMYVYQYKGQLYWIAEPWYEFINGDAYIQFQMNTTQVENLPQERLDNGWYWSNLGFWFQSYKLTEGNYGRYQVAAYTLPTEYSLTKIWTGSHADDFPDGYQDPQKRTGWIWESDFRPWYEFGTTNE